MKRSTFDRHAYSQSPASTRKIQKFYVSLVLFELLPHELILHILRYISRTDLIILASTSKRIRSVLQPYLFANTKVSWRDLMNNWELCKMPVIARDPYVIERLRLVDSCSKNEWTFPFAELFSSSRLPNLKSLTLETAGSSSFFKYSAVGSRLEKLSIHTVRPGSIFNLEHVSPFAALKHLTLTNFEIETFEENDSWCPNLSTLSLENCTWCYPFQLENFGREKITSLFLKYSNAFIISERFKMFLNNPNFTKLHHISITNNETNLKLTLSVHIMNLIESIPTLKTVELIGNIYNETIHNFTTYDLDNCTNYLALNNVKIFYSSFLQGS
ncbi:hypothetical protein HG535_0A01460 [Zygotorulaspora mrakii]|uniref:F-box domain-containing protein n=1 Tax=Zygotorulaspora mrakii TaxID=42260 RepID=A0A7H9AV77_ZYGMR|nr:uncharacterized protein HG535_0A01460 [Zygotorulaspora mrakii]QLG70208.1 hypothetical protein HG535_0A01460 [Zygotorulaspora mrakii]